MTGKNFLAIFLALILPLYCFAETVKLKNGKTVEGKVIEKTSQYILLEVSGVELKYYSDEIEGIEEASPERSALPLETNSEPPPASAKTATGQVFKDSEWGYSFSYPQDWEILPSEETTKGFALTIKPKQEPANAPLVLVNIQRGRISDTYLKEYLTPQDLLLALIKFPAQIEYEAPKAVPFSAAGAYLIKAFKQKAIILTNIKDIPQPLEITYRAVDEYYFFSPVLSGDKNDNRLFSVVIGYTLYSELGAKDPSLKSSEIAQKFNSEFILKNQKTETLLKEAQRIIESFNYSLVPQAQGSPAEIFPSPQIDSVATGEPQAVEFPKLSLSKLQELQGYLHKGDKLFWDKQYKEAITELEKALSINPYHAPTLYYLGRAYFYMDQVQRAMEYYQRVLRIAPNYPEGYLGMGQVSASLSRYQEAIKYYRKALEMSPDNVEVYINLGYLYKTMAKFQEARENLQKARQILERKDDKRALSIIDEYLNDIPQ